MDRTVHEVAESLTPLSDFHFSLSPPSQTSGSVAARSRALWFCPGGEGVRGDPTHGLIHQMAPELGFCQRSFFSRCTASLSQKKPSQPG